MPPLPFPPLNVTTQQTRFHIPNSPSPSPSSSPCPTLNSTIDIPALTLALGARPILTDAHLKLAPGTRYVLAGRNGAGKSTLLRALGAGMVPGIGGGGVRVGWLRQTGGGEEGERGGEGQNAGEEESVVEFVVRSDVVRERAVRRARDLQQALDTGEPDAPVRALRGIKHEDRRWELGEARKAAALRSGVRGLRARKELKALEETVACEEARLQVIDEDRIAAETDEAVLMLAALEGELEAMSASTAHTRAEGILLGLGFPASTISKPLSALSGGYVMRTRLASLLIQYHDLLLLDEPTNFLDLPSLLWLESHLLTALPAKTTLLLVTHDRAFADAVADQVLVLRDCALEHFPGTLSGSLHSRAQQQRRLTKMKAAQDTQIAHMKASIAGNVRAAKASGDDKKLKQAVSRQKRIDDRMGYNVGVRGGKFKLNRDLPGYHTSMRADIEIPKDDPAVKILIPVNPAPELRFPGALVACEGLTFKYPGANEVVLKGVTLTIHQTDRIALVGLNGAGKSTLVSCLVGQETPSQGTVDRHPRARIGYFSQAAVEALPGGVTALEYVGGTPGTGDEQAKRGMFSAMGLVGKTVSEIPLEQLSGGQRVRVALARILHPGDGVVPHLLVLDEVTTHLDAGSIQVLAAGLRKYKGAVVLVSHDRWFVRRVVEGEKEWEGGDAEGEWDEDSGEDDESGGERPPGKVYLVGKGGVELLKGGVGEFEAKLKKQGRKKKML